MRKMMMALALLGLIAVSANAQDLDAAQNKLLAKRAAQADCYRKLAETINGVQITSDTLVRDFVTERDDIKSRMDTFVKGARMGPPRYYEDGSCEMDAEVTIAKLIETLEEAHHEYYQGGAIKKTDFQRITQTMKKDIIRVTGMGAPRPELPPGLPEGIEAVLDPLPPQYAPNPMSLPGVWKNIPAQARLMAIRAAQLDAQRQLLERINGLRLNSNTLVRDFMTEYDEITTRASGLVVGASEVTRYLHHDEPIVEVTMEVSVEKVITAIEEMHREYYRGNRVEIKDIRTVRKTVKRNVFTATGSGVPPRKYMRQIARGAAAMPEWAGRPVSVVGEGTDPQMNTAQGKLRARRAAELDGYRKLAEQIYGLQVDSSTLVRDFVTEYDEIRMQLDAVIRGAVPGRPEYLTDMVRVEVTLSSADVWRVVHQQKIIIGHRG